MEEERPSDKPVQAIREKMRNFLIYNRRIQKDDETDLRRCLTNLRVTETVAAKANKLKCKSVSTSDLTFLQNALVDDPESVKVMLQTSGVLRILVRELSGHNVSRQCAACGCLCNITLAGPKASCIVAKVAGAYLVAALDTLSTQLSVICSWTLGNLGGAGARACSLISAQGAVSKLCDVTQAGGEVQEAAVYALTHIAYVLRDDLRPEHLHKIVQSLAKTELNITSFHLLFILSCHKGFTVGLISEVFIQKLLEHLRVSMNDHINICNRSKTYDGARVGDQDIAGVRDQDIAEACDQDIAEACDQDIVGACGQDIAGAGGQDIAGAGGQDIAGACGQDIAGACGQDMAGARGKACGEVSDEDYGNVYDQNNTSTKCCELFYLLRVFANLNSDKVYQVLVDYFVSNDMAGNIRKLLEIEDKSMLWLLGNMSNFCGDHVFFNLLISNI